MTSFWLSAGFGCKKSVLSRAMVDGPLDTWEQDAGSETSRRGEDIHGPSGKVLELNVVQVKRFSECVWVMTTASFIFKGNSSKRNIAASC